MPPDLLLGNQANPLVVPYGRSLTRRRGTRAPRLTARPGYELAEVSYSEDSRRGGDFRGNVPALTVSSG